MKEKLSDIFGADLRSLAALRLVLALLIILDLVRRSRDLVAHYTDFGVLPRAALIESEYSRWRLSIHLANGTWEFQALLFCIAAAFAVSLLIGYRTRLATIVSWFMLASLNSRNPLLLDGGDVLLRMTLFWAMFLPLGACWSVDRALNQNDSALPERTLSAATFAYLAQFIFVYWFSVLHKDVLEWFIDGGAIYYTLHFEQIVTPFGRYLLHFPALTILLTRAVFLFEIIGPLLLISPVVTGPIRAAAILGFFILHFGIGLCMDVGIFTWAASFGMVGLLPSWFWNKLLGRLKTSERLETKVFYDRECAFCWATVRLIKTFLLLPETAVVPAQSDPSIEAAMRAQNSWVVVDEKGSKHFRFRAVSVLAARSPLAWPIAPLLRHSRIERLGEALYAFVARHRRKMGCSWNRPPATAAPIMPRLGTFLNAVILVVLGYVFIWNVATLPDSRVRLSERTMALGELLRIDQIWNMFSPPPKYDGWYVIAGKLKSGEVVDLFRGGEILSWEKPLSVRDTFPSYRWWKYLFTLWNKRDPAAWSNYSAYLCRSWNRNHQRSSQTLEELQIILMLEPTLPNNRNGAVQKLIFNRHQCVRSQAGAE